MNPEQRRARQQRANENRQATGRPGSSSSSTGGRGLDRLRTYESGRDPFLDSPQWQQLNAMLLPYGGYSICYLCGHVVWNDKAVLDHVVSRAERPDLKAAVSNLKPCHGSMPGQACETCGLHCNSIKGGYSADRARKIITRRLIKMELEVPDMLLEYVPGYKAAKPAEEGREWF